MAEKSEVSIFTSHLRKLLSSCHAYMMNPRLTFLIYDIGMMRRLVGAVHVHKSKLQPARLADKVNIQNTRQANIYIKLKKQISS